MGEKKMTPEEEKAMQEMMAMLTKLFNMGVDAVKKAYQFIQNKRSQTYQILTYSNVVAGLVNLRPKDTAIVKGAALKKQIRPDRIEVTLLYLDVNNEPVWGEDPKHPYGCVCITKQLDQELIELFGDKDLIVFE